MSEISWPKPEDFRPCEMHPELQKMQQVGRPLRNLMQNIPVANALELKRALNTFTDEQLEGIAIVIDETDIEAEDGVEIEFSESCKVMTILGPHL
ncbi:hypothetical protein D3C75_224280 [compost metagenome]